VAGMRGVILVFLFLVLVSAQLPAENNDQSIATPSLWGIITHLFFHPQGEAENMMQAEAPPAAVAGTLTATEVNGDHKASRDQYIPSNNSTLILPSNQTSSNATHLTLTLSQIEQLISEDNYSEAIDELFSLLESFPTNQRANSLLGYCFLTINEPILAETFLFIAVTQSNYSDPNALLNLIDCLKMNQRYEVALSLLIHLRSSYPEEDQRLTQYSSSSSYYLIGTIYEHQQDYLSAQEWYLSGALYHSDDILAWLRASTILFPMEERNLTLAEIVLLQGVRYNPTNSELLFSLGSLFHSTNRILEAKIFYEETLRVSPNMTSALANYATVLHTIGQLSEAKRYYERAIELSSKTSTISGAISGGGSESGGVSVVGPSSSDKGNSISGNGGNAILFANYALCLSSLNYHRAAYRAITQASRADPEDRSIQTDRKKLFALLQNSNQMRGSLLRTIGRLFLSYDFDEILSTLVSYGEPRDEENDESLVLGLEEEEENNLESGDGVRGGGGAWWYYTMGIVEYFRKQYPNSIKYCSLANGMTHKQSVLINSCLGLSYQALGMYPNAIAHFEQSYNLAQSVHQLEPMPSFTFNLTTHDIQYNLQQSYSLSSQYDHCLTASCDMFDLPPPQTGGIVVLAFSYVKWSKSGQKTIDRYSQQPNQRNKIQIHSGKLLSEEVSKAEWDGRVRCRVINLSPLVGHPDSSSPI
jgi:tetratricopeptide (TPR) repeat protein